MRRGAFARSRGARRGHGRRCDAAATTIDDRRRRYRGGDAWWRAANYLSVGQIYLLDNPLLREPLRRARQAAAARPLGHDAGLNFIYAT
jgi:phosphoketolase